MSGFFALQKVPHRFIRISLHPVFFSDINLGFNNGNGSLCLMSHRLGSRLDFPSDDTISLPLSPGYILSSGPLRLCFGNVACLQCCYSISIPVVSFEYVLRRCFHNLVLGAASFIVHDTRHSPQKERRSPKSYLSLPAFLNESCSHKPAHGASALMRS